MPDSAIITGTVRDRETGAPLAQAAVSLVDLGQTVHTDEQGRYRLSLVAAGPQHMVVRRIGYRARTLHALVPPSGTLTIDVTLEPVAVALRPIEVEVELPVPGLDPGVAAPAYPDRGVSLAAIRNHPALAEPDVLLATGGAEVQLQPESADGIHVRGGAADQVAYLLDGIPVLNPYHAAGTFSAWNPDALAGLELFTFAPPPGTPDALSGVVAARTRPPGSEHHTAGAVTTTQARATIDGPVRGAGSGYLVSLRSAFPGLLFHRREATYLNGESLDGLGTLDLPLFGGGLHLMGYGNRNEIETLATVGPAPAGGLRARNEFTWDSHSLGLSWSRSLGATGLTLRAWRAVGEASANWRVADSVPERLEARRQDSGILAQVQLTEARHTTVLGLRSEWSHTAYEVAALRGAGGPSLRLDARTPVASLFASHDQTLFTGGSVRLALTGAAGAGRLHLSPAAEVRWTPVPSLTLTGGASRRHQFAQSLRNPESVLGNIFPAELFVGSGSDRIRVARSDAAMVALEYRPRPGIRLAGQGYLREFSDLTLVAPRDADPFATTGVASGSGTARGLAFEAAAHGTRFGILASYGLQRVRLRSGNSTYVPEHGVTHALDAGVIAYPFNRAALKVSTHALFGRRTTTLEGPFEWEGCNLLDRGCEFAGSPHVRAEPLGSTTLPAYLRIDAGFRYHLHFDLAGRDLVVALFGTVTNLLARSNVLTLVADPESGRRRRITMRPRSPLVLGMEWRY